MMSLSAAFSNVPKTICGASDKTLLSANCELARFKSRNNTSLLSDFSFETTSKRLFFGNVNVSESFV